MLNKLFEPIEVGGVRIKNRMSTAPMEVLYCDENGMVTDQYLKYVEARAKGGFGLIINEAHAVMKGTGGFRRCSGMWMDEQIEGQAKVAAALKSPSSSFMSDARVRSRLPTVRLRLPLL